MRITDVAAAKSRFDGKWTPEPNTGCHLWTAGLNGAGYGAYWYEGRQEVASRWIWIKNNGPIPPGMQVLHKCDQPLCVNIDHLFIGDNAMNMADKVSKGRQSAVQGSAHPLSLLTDSQVRGIKFCLGLKKFTQKQIAEWYGVSNKKISKISLGKAWGHI